MVRAKTPLIWLALVLDIMSKLLHSEENDLMNSSLLMCRRAWAVPRDRQNADRRSSWLPYGVAEAGRFQGPALLFLGGGGGVRVEGLGGFGLRGG